MQCEVLYSGQRSVGVQHRALCRSLQVSIGFRGNQLLLAEFTRRWNKLHVSLNFVEIHTMLLEGG